MANKKAAPKLAEGFEEVPLSEGFEEVPMKASSTSLSAKAEFEAGNPRAVMRRDLPDGGVGPSEYTNPVSAYKTAGAHALNEFMGPIPEFALSQDKRNSMTSQAMGVSPETVKMALEGNQNLPAETFGKLAGSVAGGQAMGKAISGTWTGVKAIGQGMRKLALAVADSEAFNIYGGALKALVKLDGKKTAQILETPASFSSPKVLRQTAKNIDDSMNAVGGELKTQYKLLSKQLPKEALDDADGLRQYVINQVDAEATAEGIKYGDDYYKILNEELKNVFSTFGKKQKPTPEELWGRLKGMARENPSKSGKFDLDATRTGVRHLINVKIRQRIQDYAEYQMQRSGDPTLAQKMSQLNESYSLMAKGKIKYEQRLRAPNDVVNMQVAKDEAARVLSLGRQIPDRNLQVLYRVLKTSGLAGVARLHTDWMSSNSSYREAVGDALESIRPDLEVETPE